MAAKKAKAKAPNAKTPASPPQKKAAPAAPPPSTVKVQKPPATPAAAPTAAARPAAALEGNSPGSNAALRVKRPLPAKSVQKAANAFKNFSLSRFPKASTPANYVPAAQAKMPSAVAALQRKSMTVQTAALAANPPPTLGLTVALTAQSLSEFLPSLNASAGTVDLTELLGALQQNLRGREFYASGNPTLNLVVQESALLSQVQAYISAVKAGTVGTVTVAGTGNPGAAAKAAPAANPGAGAKVGAAVKLGAAAKPRGVANAAAAKKAAAIKKGGA